MPRPSKIQQTSMAEKVCNELMDWIMDGQLIMGQRIATEDLANQLGVSRMPVREALKMLEKMGLAESVPYVGTRIVNLAISDIEQIYMMRFALEPTAAYYACLNATEEEVKDILELHSRFTHMMENNAPTAQEIFVCNRDFHFALYQSSKMNKYCDTIGILWNSLAFCKLIYGQTYVTDREAGIKMLEEHQRYCNYLVNREAEVMQRELKEHLANVLAQMPNKLARFFENDGAEGKE